MMGGTERERGFLNFETANIQTFHSAFIGGFNSRKTHGTPSKGVPFAPARIAGATFKVAHAQTLCSAFSK